MKNKVNFKVNETLHSAVRTGEYETVVELLSAGADINYKDEFSNDALFYAVAHYKTSIVNYLIEKGANLGMFYKDGKNILHIAVESECEYKGEVAIVETLIKSGAQVNLQDKFGNTPLWYACIYFVVNVKTINILLQNGANMNLVNKYGGSVYSVAKENDQAELLKILNKYR